MINELIIDNLKSINVLNFKCSNLNLFVGTNSSGKSTVLQALLLISQNMAQKSGLNGYLASLGEFREAKNFNTDRNLIGMSVKNDSGEVKVMFTESESGVCTEIMSTNEELKEIIKFENKILHYLSCNRIGAMDIYTKNLSGYDDFGVNGEYAMNYLMKNAKKVLDKELIMTTDSYVLLHQVNYWMQYIVNASINTENIISTDVLKAKYSIVEGKELRPKNVGSGISYLSSLIIMCLASEQSDILIIENPEIHLHPKAQARVCEFLYFIAKSGRQLFVETHSDHLFNGIRAGIATNAMDESKIKVNFLAMDKKHCTNNIEIKFGKRGKILNQTNDLFDQFDMDLNRMLGL